MMPTLIERFEAKVRKTAGCWLWTASSSPLGYGHISIGSRTDGSRRTVRAHRLAWELYVGPIPDGLLVRHTCDTPACVNPDHLQLGTNQDNMDDMAERGRARRDHCGNGHAFTPENTRVSLEGRRTRRYCRTCCRERQRVNREAKRRQKDEVKP